MTAISFILTGKLLQDGLRHFRLQNVVGLLRLPRPIDTGVGEAASVPHGSYKPLPLRGRQNMAHLTGRHARQVFLVVT